MSPFSVRLGAVAGWLSLLGLIVGLIVLPMATAGQPPDAGATTAELRAYFSHPELAVLWGYVAGFVALGFIAFALGLRTVLGRGSDRDRALTDFAVALVVLAMGVNLASGALVAGLVTAATNGSGELLTLARLHDVTYDGLGDVVEGGWIGAFSIAMLSGLLPRWIGWFGIVLAVAHWLKALGPFVSQPSVVDAAFGILIVVWFLATVISLTRVGFGARSQLVFEGG